MKSRKFTHYQVNDRRDYYRNQYLKSDHWKDLRCRVLEASQRCVICGTDKTLDVHHRHYRNLYDVRPHDLVVLCRKHHDLLHFRTGELSGRGKEMVLEHRLELMMALSSEKFYTKGNSV